MGMKWCLMAALALLSICTVPSSAQPPEGSTIFEQIKYTFLDEGSPLFGIPIVTCITTIGKLPSVVELINKGKLTVLCPEDPVFEALPNSTNPFKSYIAAGDADVLTKLFLYHIFTVFYVADPLNKVEGSPAAALFNVVLNQELQTALGLKIYGSQRNQQIQFSETKIPIGQQLPLNATSIGYLDQFVSQEGEVSVQTLTGIFVPPKEEHCNIAADLCASPPAIVPVAAPKSPSTPPSLPVPPVATPPVVSPSPAPPKEAPSPSPSAANALSMSWVLLALPLAALLL